LTFKKAKQKRKLVQTNFIDCGERTFNNLRTDFAVKIPEKEFFNSHAW
jgi:hypothetical protein